MKFNFILSVLACLFAVNVAQAQVVTTSPVFPTENDLITLTFDATQGSGGLANFPATGKVYIHTGITIAAAPWQYASPPAWGSELPSRLMTRSATNPNIYTFVLTPSARAFYGLTAAQVGTELSMVFYGDLVSSGGANRKEGKGTGGTDIFMPLYAAGSPLLTIFQNPAIDYGVYNTGANVTLTAAASVPATCSFTVDGVQGATTPNVTTLTQSITAGAAGDHTIVFTAVAGAQTSTATYHYTVASTLVQDAPTGTVNGINYLGGGNIRLQLTAPQKGNVYVVGSFNNWTPSATYQMKKDVNGNRFWIDLSLTPGSKYTYQYYIDGTLRVADPLSEVVLNQWDDPYIPAVNYPNRPTFPGTKAIGNVSLIELDLPAYQWQNTANYVRPKKTDLIVYELLVRDFTSAQSFNKVKDSLNYLQTMGVNCIEFMPISEFEGNLSWGYNTSFHGALDKYYGTRTAFKQLVDECHRRNIAVVMDIAFNHVFSQSPLAQMYWDASTSPSRPAADNPWLNQTAKHDFNVGSDMNHESQWTREYVVQCCKRWMTDFQVDGFRFDLSKGFTQRNTLGNTGAWGAYDASRIAILAHYATQLRTTDPNALLILEHFTNSDNNEEKELSDIHGFMPWGNGTYTWNETSMGYTNDNSYATSYKARNWANPNLVSFMESHDEERLMYKNLTYGNSTQAPTYDVKTLATALKRQEMVAAMFFTVPGPKMIWQFGEIGYDISITQCATTPITFSTNCRLDSKPLLWNYLTVAARKHLYDVYTKILKVRTAEPAFETTNFTTNLSGMTKIIKLNHSDMNVLAIANSAVTGNTSTPVFQNTGTWYELFTGNTLDVTDVNTPITLTPGEYRIYTSRPVVIGTEPIAPNSLWSMMLFPNPTQTETAIAYSLPENTAVTVEVFDMLGRKMATLAQNETQTAGIQQIDYNTADLPQGTYIVRLSANGAQEVRKLVKQ
jgi:1,4-alpha-glucan branching enzyme